MSFRCALNRTALSYLRQSCRPLIRLRIHAKILTTLPVRLLLNCGIQIILFLCGDGGWLKAHQLPAYKSISTVCLSSLRRDHVLRPPLRNWITFLVIKCDVDIDPNYMVLWLTQPGFDLPSMVMFFGLEVRFIWDSFSGILQALLGQAIDHELAIRVPPLDCRFFSLTLL